MPGLYSHTTRATGTVLTAAIYNGDHQNHIDNLIPSMIDDQSPNVAAMQATTSPGGVGTESLPTNLQGELERIRHVIKTMHSGAQWYPGGALVGGSTGSTDNALLRADGTGGATVQGSVATLTDNGGTLTVTNSSAATGTLLLDRTDTHGDNVLVGNIEFRGRDSGAAAQAYAFIDARCVLDNAGAETGGLEIRTGNAGSATQRLMIRTGVYTPNATGTDMGADTFNGSNLYVNGKAVTEVILATSTPSAVATVDFASGIDSTYDEYILRGWLQPATDQVDLWLRFSDDGGVTYEADAADYGYGAGGNSDSASYHLGSGSSGADQIRLTTSSTTDLVGNASTEYIQFKITFAKPDSTSLNKLVLFDCAWLDTATQVNRSYGAAQMIATAAANGARLLFSSGNVAAGFVELIGVKKS